MSGFVVIIDPAGGTPEPSLIAILAERLKYRAPDGTTVSVSPGVGIAQASLHGTRARPTGDHRVKEESARYDIVADARIDDRATLAASLSSAGTHASAGDSEESLILAAYHTWGSACVTHLLGDFAFVVWDREQRRGFAARDHFGVKPFYFAQVNDRLVASNTIEAVRAFPGVSSALDEVTIADLLVFGWKLDLTRTTFSAISALPPGHFMVIGSMPTEPVRYWSVPIEDPLHYPRIRDYADHFDALFTHAVEDRIGPAVTTVLMSGGRDSTAIAATAQRTIANSRDGRSLRAVTTVYDRTMPDDERKFATIAARALGIPIEFLVLDDYAMLDGFRGHALRAPEPILDPMPAMTADLLQLAARTGSVVLDGTGGDGIQRESESRLARLITQRRFGTVLRETLSFIRWHRRLPRPGFRTLRRQLRAKGRHQVAPFPEWLEPGFEQRLRLRERWLEYATSTSAHPTRPEAHSQITNPMWTGIFEKQDAGATGVPLDIRYPFFDVRLVRFLLSVPPGQWYNDKGLLRIVMRGRLPDAIVDRQKAPLAGDPIEVRLQRYKSNWLGGAKISPSIDPYVRRRAVPTLFGGTSSENWGGSSSTLYPLLLAIWMETS